MNAFVAKYIRQAARSAVLSISLLAAVSAFADTSKISPDLLPLLSNSSGSVNVIVQYNTPPACSGGSGLLGVVVGGLTCTVSNVVNLAVHTVFSVINAVTGTMQVGDVLAMSNQSNVSYISLDRPVAGLLDYSTGAVNAPVAWNSGLNGAGVGIAIIDSGIYAHPDLAAAHSSQSRVVYRQNFIGGAVQSDDFGHGTHVAGIAAGNGSASSMPGSSHVLRGVAPNANLSISGCWTRTA